MSFLRVLIFVFYTSIGLSAQPYFKTLSASKFKLQDINSGKVTSVKATGTPGNYNFSVGILSPDTGCEQYANWWEVLNLEGELIYRRILLHSHVNEQPFIRSGGIVAISADTTVIVRMHMNSTGYSPKIFKGSVNTGFKNAIIDANFAFKLEHVKPLPKGCAF